MNREEILKLMQNKDWVSLIEKFKNNEIHSLIKKDTILSNIINSHFITELITGNSFTQDAAYSYYLEQFYILHKSNKFDFVLKKSDFEKLIQKITLEYNQRGQLDVATKYAREFPENKQCKETIEKYEKEQAKIIRHSQSRKITLSQNNTVSENDNTTSLFKSKQEYRFYRAVREVFPSYMVFPNVGMNAIVDFDAIKDNLSNKEKRFYFMGLIDCVVIDQENNYRPIKFIELDSFTHDNEKQQINDKMKDKIIGLAGHKLYRIRSDNDEITEDEFKLLIREKL